MLVTVAGATGSIGWRVIGLLFDLKRDDITMIALSRRHLDNTFRRRVVQRRIQYDDEASLQAALAGVDTLVFPGSDGDPEQMLQHHRNVIAAAQWCKQLLCSLVDPEFFLDSFVGPTLSTGIMQLPGDGGDVSFISKGDVAAAIAGAVLIESGSCMFNLLLGSTQPRPC